MTHCVRVAQVEYALTHLRGKLDEVERRRIAKALDQDRGGAVCRT